MLDNVKVVKLAMILVLSSTIGAIATNFKFPFWSSYLCGVFISITSLLMFWNELK